jgi:hypothetical protein
VCRGRGRCNGSGCVAEARGIHRFTAEACVIGPLPSVHAAPSLSVILHTCSRRRTCPRRSSAARARTRASRVLRTAPSRTMWRLWRASGSW